MIKRGILYTLVLALVGFGVFSVYREYAPDVIDYVPETINYNIYPLYNQNTIDDYLLSQSQDSFVLFYKSQATNSIYLFNKLLTRLLQEYEIDQIDGLVFCNVDTMDLSENETKNRWGFYQTPALVRIKANDTVLEVVSSLEWSDTKSLTYEEVVNWLRTNELIFQKQLGE